MILPSWILGSGVVCLEGTPVPVPRHTARDALLCLATIVVDPHYRRRTRLIEAAFSGNTVRTRDACGSPLAIPVVTVLAGAALRTFGMEFGVLVQGGGEGGMRVAEHVPAVPTVMAPLEQ